MILADVPMADYIADKFDGPPSLSSGLAHTLLTKSAAHCRFGHPRLNPLWAPDDETRFDVGTAAHAALLEGKPLYVVEITDEKTGEILRPTDYKKKATQQSRDVAKASGRFPVLAHQADAITGMVTTARAKLATCSSLDYAPARFEAERTIRWQESGAWLRCRPDWLSRDRKLIVSYKTTRAMAEPGAFMRTILSGGYELQAAFEMAAVASVTGVEPQYVWLAQECSEPFACSLVGMTGQVRDFAAMRLRQAVTLWSVCLQDDDWPAYSDEIERPELPAWAQTAFIDRYGYAPPPIDDGRELADQLFGKEV